MSVFQKIRSGITENVESLTENLSKNKQQDELFRFAERGDLTAFIAALPESKIPRERMAPSDKTKRMTLASMVSGNLFKKDIDLNAQNENGYTVLHLAALNGHEEFVEKLLEFGVETLAKDQSGNSALHLAAWNGHEKILRLLLKAGSNVNDVNLEGNTPLHFTAQYGKDKLSAHALLENGANPLIRNRVYETPLDLAARFGRLPIVQELATPEVLRQIYRKSERPRSSPLHLAALNGHAEVVRHLLSTNVDINTVNYEGSTALHEATQYGKRAVVLLLLQHGAAVNVVNDRSQTPLKLFNAFNAQAQNNPIQAVLIAAEQGVDPASLEEIMNNAIIAGRGSIATPGSPGPLSPSASTHEFTYAPPPVLSQAVQSKKTSVSNASAAASKPRGARSRAVVQYPGSAYDSTVLSFEVGDIIWVEEQNASGWWRGTHEKTGKRGDFKANYVEIIADEDNSAAQQQQQQQLPPSYTAFAPQQAHSTQPAPIVSPPPVAPLSRTPSSASSMSRSSSGSNLPVGSDMPTSTPPPPGTAKKPIGGQSYGVMGLAGVTLKAAPAKQETPASSTPPKPFEFGEPNESAPQAPLPDDAKWIERWLYDLKLERYLPNFTDNGYDTRELIIEMGPGDLEMIDVKLPGHRKKLLLAIDKLRTQSATMSPVVIPTPLPPVAAAETVTQRPPSNILPAPPAALPPPPALPPAQSFAAPAVAAFQNLPPPPKPILPAPIVAPIPPANPPPLPPSINTSSPVFIESKSNSELENLINELETPLETVTFPVISKPGFAELPKATAVPSKPIEPTTPPPLPAAAAAAVPSVAPPPTAVKPSGLPPSIQAPKPVQVPVPIAAPAPAPAPVPVPAPAPAPAPVPTPSYSTVPAKVVAPTPVAAPVVVAAAPKPAAAPPVVAQAAAVKKEPSFEDLLNDVDDIMAGLEAQLDSMR